MDQLVKWLREKFNNPSIIAVGSSAGGNMAVELGIKYGFPSISLSGILAIDSWLEGHEEVAGKPDTTQDFTNAASATINQTGHDDSFYKWFLMNYLNNDMTLAEKATPYRRVGSTADPMMLVNSLNEFVPTSGVSHWQNDSCRTTSQSRPPFYLVRACKGVPGASLAAN